MAKKCYMGHICPNKENTCSVTNSLMLLGARGYDHGFEKFVETVGAKNIKASDQVHIFRVRGDTMEMTNTGHHYRWSIWASDSITKEKQ